MHFCRSFLFGKISITINTNDLVHSYEEGGLNVIDLEIMNSVLKTKWLR